jgi:crotonobetainyl-CoA:carnitine CoA-transferase CaiB-like acyl-CoA transferase
MAAGSPGICALDGLQVLDCSRGMGGPMAAMLLADLRGRNGQSRQPG